MGYYLAYAKSGMEFEVADELRALGLEVYHPRQLKRKQYGRTRRDVRFYDAPYFPNFIFVKIPAEKYLDALGVRGLAKTTVAVTKKEFEGWPPAVDSNGNERAGNPGVRGFLEVADAEYAKAEREKAELEQNAKRGELISAYEPGQAIQVLDGRFSDKMLTFRAMVMRAHDLYPTVKAEMEMMGQNVIIELDPLMVRAAE